MDSAPRTGKPSYCKNDKNEKIDLITHKKLDYYKKIKNDNEVNNLGDIKNSKGKIALIYADGNGLGAIVKNLAKDLKKLNEFSKNLDNAIKKAFENAQDELIKAKFRKIICGGDDLILICNPDCALNFINKFLGEFEKLTQKLENGLTACAGIVFCQYKYPIHSALNLAKKLCNDAKNEAKNRDKNRAPSCVKFHNIQSSNLGGDFFERELFIEKSKLNLDFGAYYLNEAPKISALIEICKILDENNQITSRLRNNLNLFNVDFNIAKFDLKRIAEVNKGIVEKINSALQKLDSNLSLETPFIESESRKTPIYNILQILSVCDDNAFKENPKDENENRI